MTPASSGRYQSRLFRFIHKQSRRFTQQCDRAWRNLQSTAGWVASVGLYPLFLLFQSSRSTANQVHQAVEQTLHQLPADDEDTLAPAVDTPIQQVLLYVTGVREKRSFVQGEGGSGREIDNFPLSPLPLIPTPWGPRVPLVLTTPDSPVGAHSSAPLPTPSIRGIASQLSSRNLVLVTAQNQVLDVLDPQQQESLQEKIIAAVAEYWRDRRLARSLKSQPFSLPTPGSPVGAHSRATLPTPPWLASLDHTVAEVESHHLAQFKSAAIALYQRFNLSRSDRAASEVRAEEGSKTHTTRILSLIWAAIDYFFGTGDRASGSFASGTSQNGANPHLAGKPANPKFPANHLSQLPTSHNLADEDLEDLWLTASDLFGSVAVETTTRDRSIPAIALPANPAADYALSDKNTSFRQFLFKTRTPKGIVKKQQAAKGITKRHRTTEDPPNPPYKGGQQSTPQISRWQKRADNFLNPPDQGGQGGIGSEAKSQQSPQKAETRDISPSTGKNSSVQPTPDWIEIPATLMGYVKHPLEQILAWLDRVMLWLEETLLKFWQWWQKMWRKL